MKTYKAKDMLKVTGVSRDLYNQWVFKGVVRPYKPADGPGHHAEFTFGNLVSMKLMLKLRNMGRRLKQTAVIGETIRGIIDKGYDPEKFLLMINSENPSEFCTFDFDTFKGLYNYSRWPVSQIFDLSKFSDEVSKILNSES